MSNNPEDARDPTLTDEADIVRYNQILQEEMERSAEEVGGYDYVGYEESIGIIDRAKERMEMEKKYE